MCAASLVAFGCVTQQPATDVAESITGPTPVSATAATSTTTTPSTSTPVRFLRLPSPWLYVQDLQPIFQSDCVPCHSGSRPDGNYSMSTYAQVMRAVAAGNARSALVVVTQRNASMYRYWSGNATTKATKAELVRKWVVENGAAQTR